MIKTTTKYESEKAEKVLSLFCHDGHPTINMVFVNRIHSICTHRWMTFETWVIAIHLTFRQMFAIEGLFVRAWPAMLIMSCYDFMVSYPDLFVI